MSYVPELDICVKSYNHSNFSRGFVVQFRASRYIMSQNRTSVWKVMTIWNFSRASTMQFRAPWYIMSPNRTSVLKTMTIRISRELPLFDFHPPDILCPRIGHPCENSWPFEFLESFICSISSVSINYVPKSDIREKSYDHSNFSRASVIQFRSSRYIMSPNRTSVWKFMTIWISREVPLFNFECLDILCPKIGHPCEKL